MANLGENLMKELLDLYLEEHCLNNYKPSWLAGLEMDRYYPSLRTAFEFQGDQHFGYSFSLFNSHKEFFEQINRDNKKRFILTTKKVHLVEIVPDDLSPERFCEKLSIVFMEPVFDKTDATLKKKIIQYQKWLNIHQKQEVKSLLDELGVFRFLGIRNGKKLISELFDLEGYDLTFDEKVVFCLLSILSKNGEVILSIEQLDEIIPQMKIIDKCYSLFEKRLLLIHPIFKLIRLRETECSIAQSFVSKLISI